MRLPAWQFPPPSQFSQFQLKWKNSKSLKVMLCYYRCWEIACCLEETVFPRRESPAVAQPVRPQLAERPARVLTALATTHRPLHSQNAREMERAGMPWDRQREYRAWPSWKTKPCGFACLQSNSFYSRILYFRNYRNTIRRTRWYKHQRQNSSVS